MDLSSLLLLLLAAGGAGVLAGSFRVAGSLFLIPFLLLFYRSVGVTFIVSTHLAMGTSLLVTAVVAGIAAYRSEKQGFVVRRATLFLGGAGVVGAFSGGWSVALVEGASLRRIFAVVAGIAALQLFSDRRKPKDQREPPLLSARLAFAGLLLGVLSALSGVPGAHLAFPVLYSLLHFPQMKSLGTSSASMAAMGVAGAAGYAVAGFHEILLPAGCLGFVDLMHAIPLLAAYVPAALFGDALAERTKSKTPRMILGTLLLAMALKLLVSP